MAHETIYQDVAGDDSSGLGCIAASPCALAISVPVAVLAAVGAASKLAVLVKGGAGRRRGRGARRTTSRSP